MTTSIHKLLSISAAVSLAATALPAQDGRFEPPVLVQAGGETIDMGEHVGYAGPALNDANGDGLLDLYVGCFRGKILFAENVGTAKQPKFDTAKFLQAEGKDIEISNW